MAGAAAPTQRIEKLEAAAFRSTSEMEEVRDQLRVIAETLVEIEEHDGDTKSRLILVNEKLATVNEKQEQIFSELAGVKRNQNMMLGMIRSIGNKLDVIMPEGD